MKEDLIKRLLALNIKNVQVEKELNLPLNSLSAVLNGKKKMPDKWVKPVADYLVSKEPPLTKEPLKPIKDPTRPWIEEIEIYCRSKGLYPDQLIEFHQMHSNSETTKALQLLKKGMEAASNATEARKLVNSGDKSKQMYEPPEGSNAHLMRYGALYKKDISK